MGRGKTANPEVTLTGDDSGSPGRLGHGLPELEPGEHPASSRAPQSQVTRQARVSRDRQARPPPPHSPETRDRGPRSPEPPRGQQTLAEVRAQMAERRLRLRHLQRLGPLLKPHAQLHGDRTASLGRWRRLPERRRNRKRSPLSLSRSRLRPLLPSMRAERRAPALPSHRWLGARRRPLGARCPRRRR